MSEYENSVEILRSFAERVQGAPDIQLLGGIASTALRHPDLVIDMQNRELRVPHHDLSARRPNGAKRDADILVTSSDEARIQEVKAIAFEEIQKQLTVSVCSIRSFDELQDRRRVAVSRPFSKTSFLSERYEASHAGHAYVKSLSPFAVPIEPTTLQQWQLIINDELSLPVSHPGATIANYTQRSISGVRPKDYQKMSEASQNAYAKAPELRDWLQDGPGSSQMTLTQILYSLRFEALDAVRVLGVELPLVPLDVLAEGPAFMDTFAEPEGKRRAVAQAAWKASTMYAIENNPVIVKALNNGVVERALGVFTGNK